MGRIVALFLIPTLIWGSTWIAIKFQLGTTAPEISVFIRFVIAAALTALWAAWQRLPLRFSPRQHFEFFLQGAFNYSFNYILTYYSEVSLTSGVVAVLFSLLIYMNMTGLRLFYGKRIETRTWLGALIGGIGILLIFGREFEGLEMKLEVLQGLALAIIATLFASIGNMISIRFRVKGIPVLSFNAWAMFYGALSTLAIALITGREWTFPTEPSYWSSMFYLAIVGTVVAFAAYMTLISEVGADRAAYTSIFTPVIALLISTLFESYTWSWVNGLGIALALAGNLIVLVRPRKKAV